MTRCDTRLWGDPTAVQCQRPAGHHDGHVYFSSEASQDRVTDE